jgi:hypothetical protein
VDKTRIAGLLLALFGIVFIAFRIRQNFIIGPGGNSGIGTIPVLDVMVGLILLFGGIYLAVHRSPKAKNGS